MAYAKFKKLADNLPYYPGRGQAETLLAPVIMPVAQALSGRIVQRLLGFWVLWHTYGGTMSALIDEGVMSRAKVYQNRSDFVAAFGVNVEDWQPELAALLRSSDAASQLGSPARSSARAARP